MYIIFNNKEDRNRRLPFNRVYVRLACRTFASSVCHKFDLFKQNSFVKEENASDYRCMLTMKKFLSFALVAVMLVAAVSVIAFAEAPKADDFTANNGFFIYEGKANQTDVQDPATLTDTAQGLQIVHGGYYTSGENCGGVVSTNKYDLNGFEATIYFENAPEVTTETDCWVAVDFLAAPRGFYTNNFNLEGDNPGNQGILDLIRFGKPYLEIYNGIADFSQVYNSQSVDATVNEMFAIKSGTTITVKVARNENGTYQLTFAREGFEDFVVPYEFPVQDVFPDGKAHFSVIASCEIAPEDGWTYYITDLKNGVEMTAEEIAAELKNDAITPERVREIQKIALDPVSLETPIGEEDDSHLGDFIEDKDAVSPSEYTTKSLLKDELRSVMKELTDREERVLRLRYGLDDDRPRTLEEVGKEFGVTRERIRQIEAKAIRKLRHPARAKRFGDFRD